MSFFEPGGVVSEPGRSTPHRQNPSNRVMARNTDVEYPYRWCLLTMSTNSKAHIQHEEDDRTLCDRRTVWPEPARYQDGIAHSRRWVCGRCLADMQAELQGGET